MGDAGAGLWRRAGGRSHHIAVIDGPNMSNLGRRNPRVYGPISSLTALQEFVTRAGKDLGVEVETFASNHEGNILEFIHDAAERADAFIINPAGLTTGGEATRHALEESRRPYVEVHFSNIVAPPWSDRGLPGGPWESRFTRSATGMSMGLRQHSYIGALVALVAALDDGEFLGKASA